MVEGIIGVKTRIVCRVRAVIVRMPCCLRFFLPFIPLTDGNAKISSKRLTKDNAKTIVPKGSKGSIVKHPHKIGLFAQFIIEF